MLSVNVCKCRETSTEKQKLTVRTSIGFQSESNPTIWIPVERNQADVASDHLVL